MTGATETDIAIVGAGAAGLMAALGARGAIDGDGNPVPPQDHAPGVTLLDGSSRIGLKILVSGGGRCNVTNERVVEDDYDSDAPKIVRAALRELPPDAIRSFFELRDCPLYAEPLGKLFPRSDRARDILTTLINAVTDSGAAIETDRLVAAIQPYEDGVVLRTSGGNLRADRVIIAAGGKSLPKTGSKGFGLDLAERLGHDLDPPLPALVPINLDGGPLRDLAGVTIPTLLSLVPEGSAPEQVESRRFRPLARAGGSMLVTHDGISGPAALDVSGACGLATNAGQGRAGSAVVLEADFLSLAITDGPFADYFGLKKPPGACLPDSASIRPMSLEDFKTLVEGNADSHRSSIANSLSQWLPKSLAHALLRREGETASAVDPSKAVRELSQREWQLAHVATCHADLRLQSTGGYQKAEVTRGGVRLRELHRGTLESRLTPRVHFCGEVCSATGRLGGFNFQWAWSSGYLAGRGAAARVQEATLRE